MEQPQVFISYRRNDTDADAGRLHDELVGRLGRGKVFKDVDTIPLGADFEEHIKYAIAGSAVVLVLIGPDWNTERLEDKHDWVRVELELALRRGVPVVPVTVRKGAMPQRSQLPPSLRDFCTLNAAEVEHHSWARDITPLIETVNTLLAEAEQKAAIDLATAPDHDVSRWLPGSTVAIGFLGGSTQVHREISETLTEINEACSLTLDCGYDANTQTFRSWSTSDTEYAAHIRVSFDQPGHWSLVGADSIDPDITGPDLAVGGRPGQRSANLAGFDQRLPARWRGTVLHTFLWALGLKNEHTNPRGPFETGFRWSDDDGYQPTVDSNGAFTPDSKSRRPGIYTILSGHPNYWARAKVDHNMKADADGFWGPFDPESVMLYRFSPLFYEEDPGPCLPIGDGSRLSAGDCRRLAFMYPPVAAQQQPNR